MQIGDKIRTLRTELHMTQSELAGSEITRNMLSRIETADAMPSLDTLLYLAKRLGVPAGFLIAEESENHIYRKSAEIAKIRESYRRGDWKGCKRLCELLGVQDSESERFICGCMFHIAQDCFNCGELYKARSAFEQLILRCESNLGALYPDGLLCRILIADSCVYLRCLSDISPMFSSAYGKNADVPCGASEDPFVLYYSFYSPFGRLRADTQDAQAYIASRTKEESYYTGHIRARQWMREGKYAEAGKLISEIAYGESLMPQPVLLFLLTDLEKCFRETGDFRGAYESAGLQRELLDSFTKEGEA